MEQPIAFVIMPFAQEHREIYDVVIKPTFEQKLGWRCWRVDEHAGAGNIVRQIVEGIAGATMVIADLTLLKPNVLYELGVSHALGVPVLTLFRKGGDEMPFDLKSYRYVEYENTMSGGQHLKRRIVEAVKALPEWGAKSTNPVQDFLPVERRGSVQISVAPLPTAGQEEVLRELAYKRELAAKVRQRLHYVQLAHIESRDPGLAVEADELTRRLEELRGQMKSLNL